MISEQMLPQTDMIYHTERPMRPGAQNHLAPTKRGWMLLGRHGGPCDKECKMCYYTWQKDLVFFSQETLISRANLFRHHYGLEYVDISGGEATVLGKKVGGRRPQLEALVSHCASIGLKPTIITHGQNNTKELVDGIEAAGLNDWLISLHGMEKGHNATVVDHSGRGDGGFHRLTSNLANCKRPVRINSTLLDVNFTELPELARWLTDRLPASVHNLINFNPFFAWDDPEHKDIDFQVKQSVMAPYVAEAIAIEEAAGWETNVRYFMPCIASEFGFERNCVSFYGTQVDQWEWSLSATNRTQASVANQFGGWHGANIAYCNEIGNSRKNHVCDTCRFNQICEGPAPQYAQRFGLDELRPSAGEAVSDIAYFDKGGRF